MANSAEVGLTEFPGPTEVERADGPVPGPDELERITSKQIEEEEKFEASKGRKDGKETRRRGDSLNHMNTALVLSLSVAAVAVVGAVVIIAKKLRER